MTSYCWKWTSSEDQSSIALVGGRLASFLYGLLGGSPNWRKNRWHCCTPSLTPNFYTICADSGLPSHRLPSSPEYRDGSRNAALTRFSCSSVKLGRPGCPPSRTRISGIKTRVLHTERDIFINSVMAGYISPRRHRGWTQTERGGHRKGNHASRAAVPNAAGHHCKYITAVVSGPVTPRRPTVCKPMLFHPGLSGQATSSPCFTCAQMPPFIATAYPMRFGQ